MAVDSLFGDVQVLVQGASTGNVVAPSTTPGHEGFPWVATPTFTDVTAGADHLVFGASGRMSVDQGGYPTKTFGARLDVELVIEQEWTTTARIFESRWFLIFADYSTPNRYLVAENEYAEYSAATPRWVQKTSFFAPSSGKFLLRLSISAIRNWSASGQVDVIPETAAATSASFSVDQLVYNYSHFPFTLGSNGATADVSPPANLATASNVVQVQGSYGYSTPAVLRVIGVSYNRVSGAPQLPSSGYASMSAVGKTTNISNIAGMSAHSVVSLLSSQLADLINADAEWYASVQSTSDGGIQLVLTPRTSAVSAGTSLTVSGSATFDASGNYPAATVVLSGSASVSQSPIYSTPPALNHVQSAFVTITDATKNYILKLQLPGVPDQEFSAQGDPGAAVSSLAAAINAYGLTATTTQLGGFQWGVEFTTSNPGPITGVYVSVVERVSVPSAITKLYGLRVTAAARTETTFPTLPWPTTSIPPSTGGGGGADTLLLLHFNDTATEGGSNTYVDSSLYGRTVTGGIAVQSGDPAGLGGSSLASGFAGHLYQTATQRYATLASELTVTGNWTAEWWYFTPEGNASFSAYADGSNRVGVLNHNSSVVWSGNGSYGTQVIDVPGFSVNFSWSHFALVQNGSTLTLYIGGISRGTAAGAFSLALRNIFADASGLNMASATVAMDELRVSNTAVYTGTFTPPTAPFDNPSLPSGDVDAAGYNTLDDFTGTGTFNIQTSLPTVYFSSNAGLGDVLATGDAFVVDGNSVNFNGSRTLADTTCTGAFVFGTPVTFDGSGMLEDVTCAGGFYAGLPVEWTGASTLDDVGQIAVMLPLAPAEFSGNVALDDVVSGTTFFSLIDPLLWRVNGTIPAVTGSGRITQFYVNGTIPAITGRGRITSYRGLSVNGTIPAATISAWTGLTLHGTIPAITGEASATVVNTLRVNGVLPRVTGQASALTGHVLRVDGTIPVATLSAWTGLTLNGTIPAITGGASAVTGGAYRVNGVLPVITGSIGVSSMNVLRLVGDIPVVTRANWMAVDGTIPAARVLARISPVVATTRVAYSFTLANSAMTRYPAYPFIQVIRMGNAFYGVAEDGLHEIGGTTDNTVAIPWAWETCMSDFGQAEKKTVMSAYLGGYVPEAMTYTIRVGDAATGTNAHATTATAVLRNHRQKFGIGRKSRFFAFGLSATAGRVAIESIEFEVATMSRRI